DWREMRPLAPVGRSTVLAALPRVTRTCGPLGCWKASGAPADLLVVSIARGWNRDTSPPVTKLATLSFGMFMVVRRISSSSAALRSEERRVGKGGRWLGAW